MITTRLAELANLGVRLWEEDGVLKCTAPPGCLTESIKQELKQHKAAILALLGKGSSQSTELRKKPISKAAERDCYPLSPQHRRYMADHSWNPVYTWNTIILHIPFQHSFSIFEAAFDQVCARHQCLRTVFPFVDGSRVQKVRQEPIISTSCHSYDSEVPGDLGERRAQLVGDLVCRQWDVTNGPLGELAFLEDVQKKSNVFVLALHRIVMDGPSARLFIGEMLQAGHLLAAGKPVVLVEKKSSTDRIDYIDFSEWLNGLENQGLFDLSETYWREELSLPLPDPFQMNRCAASSSPDRSGGLVTRILDQAQVDQLKLLSQRQGWLTPIALFSVFVLALSKSGAGSDLVVDTSLVGRPQESLKQVIGYFSNAAAIRVSISDEQNFSDIVRKITKKYAGAEEHQFFQYNRIVDTLGIDRGKHLFPLSGILFNNLDIAIEPEDELVNHREWKETTADIRYGIMFYAMSYPNCISLELKHRTSLIGKDVALRIIENYCDIVQTLLDHGNDMSLRQLLR